MPDSPDSTKPLPARRPAFLAVTVGLALAYLLAAFIFARTGQVLNLGWPDRLDFWPSLALGVLALYGGAWAYSRRAVRPPAAPRRGGGRGAAYGVLLLFAAVVLAGSWNFVLEVIEHWSPDDPAARFGRRVGSAFFDWIVKPLAWIMPLGSVVAGLLGWWVGRRSN